MKLKQLSLLAGFMALILTVKANCDTCKISYFNFGYTTDWQCNITIQDTLITDTCTTPLKYFLDYGNGIKDTVNVGDPILDLFSQGTYTFCITAYVSYDSLGQTRYCSKTVCKSVTKDVCQNPWRLKYQGEEQLENTIYPNPARATVQLELSADVTLIEFIDLSGKLVYRQTPLQKIQTVDLSELSPGIYFIRMHSGEDYETQKLIVQ